MNRKSIAGILEKEVCSGVLKSVPLDINTFSDFLGKGYRLKLGCLPWKDGLLKDFYGGDIV